MIKIKTEAGDVPCSATFDLATSADCVNATNAILLCKHSPSSRGDCVEHAHFLVLRAEGLADNALGVT